MNTSPNNLPIPTGKTTGCEDVLRIKADNLLDNDVFVRLPISMQVASLAGDECNLALGSGLLADHYSKGGFWLQKPSGLELHSPGRLIANA